MTAGILTFLFSSAVIDRRYRLKSLVWRLMILNWPFDKLGMTDLL